MTQRAWPFAADVLTSAQLLLLLSQPVALESRDKAGLGKEVRCFLDQALIGHVASGVSCVSVLSSDASPAAPLLPGLSGLSPPASPSRGCQGCCLLRLSLWLFLPYFPGVPSAFPRKFLEGGPGLWGFLPALGMEGSSCAVQNTPSDFENIGADKIENHEDRSL